MRSREEGEELLREVRLAQLRGLYAPPEAAAEKPVASMTLLGAVDAYLETKRGEGRAKRGIDRYLSSRYAISQWPTSGKPVGDVTAADIEGYVSWRRSKRWKVFKPNGTKRHEPNQVKLVDGGVSTGTINRDLALLSATFARLVRLDVLAKNPCERVRRGREVQKKREAFTLEELGRYLAACGEPLRMLSLGMYYTGQRPVDLFDLRWSDIDLDGGTLSVFRRKTQNADVLPLNPAFAEELRAYRDRRAAKLGHPVAPTDHVFVSKAGKPHFGYAETFRRALAKAGLAGRNLTLYSLKNTFASLYRGQPHELQRVFGHASVTTSERYLRTLAPNVRAGIEGLPVPTVGTNRT